MHAATRRALVVMFFLMSLLAATAADAVNLCATIMKLEQGGSGSYDMVLLGDDQSRRVFHPEAAFAANHKVGDRIKTTWRGEPFGDAPCDVISWTATAQVLQESAAVTAADTSAAPESPFNGVWGGRRKSMMTNSYSEFSFTVLGPDMVGTWVGPGGPMRLTGTVSGNTITGHVEKPGGADFKMELVDPDTIRFRTTTFLGDKFELSRLKKDLPERHREISDTTFSVMVSAVANMPTSTGPNYIPPPPPRGDYPRPSNTEMSAANEVSQGPALPVMAQQMASPQVSPAASSPIAGAQNRRTQPSVAAPRASAPHSHMLHPGDVTIDGTYTSNDRNDPTYAVTLVNRADFPVDCDVSLTASFWTDSAHALNPVSGPGLARIKTVHGKVSNLQPGSQGKAMDVTHLVQNSQVHYVIDRCEVAAMHLLSERK